MNELKIEIKLRNHSQKGRL